MKKITFILVMFLVVLTAGIGTVSAETATGTFESTGIYQENKTDNGGNLATAVPNAVWFKDIGSVGTLQTILIMGSDQYATSVYNRDVGAYYSGQAPFTSELGSGIIGYNEVYDSNGGFLFMFWYITYDTFDATGKTGDVWDNLTYNRALVHNLTYPMVVGTGNVAQPYGAYPGTWASNPASRTVHISYPIHYPTQYYYLGHYLYNNVAFPFHNEYTATSNGMNVQGYINKTVEGVAYSSRGFVYDGTTNAILASEDYPATSTNWTFNVFQGNIKIGVIDAKNVSYQSGSLFSGIGTPTPTPTLPPGVYPTLAPGYVRSTVTVWDRGGNTVHGADIAIQDVETTTWHNSTSDADGSYYIDTLPYHTLDIYGAYTIFANEFLPASLTGQTVGANGGSFFVTLFPYETGLSAGNISLTVEVKDADSGNYIPYANVQAAVSGGYTYTQSTANHGSAIFTVPNNTMIHITGSASGYTSGTIAVNSGNAGTKITTINLVKKVITVAPTSTIPPGGVTPVRTLDARSASEKDAGMMNLIRDNGEGLIQLAIAVTMISLLGLLMKGLK